jgi:putative ABC transport system substrate-binding protein
LVSLNVAAILAASPTSVRAAQQVTNTIPIIMEGASEIPVELGLVASLARPGGNVTGLSIGGGLEIPGKRLQLLQETVPGLSRVAVLADATAAPFESNPKFGPLNTAAPSLGVQLQVVNVRAPEEFDGAFSAMRSNGAEAVYVDPTPLIGFNRARLVELAVQHRLPSMYPSSFYADVGLLTYGANVPDLWRRSATYIDKILKGAKPAELPVERPTKFDFIINLKMAQALGLTIPQAVLQQATQVIQ